MRLVMLFTIMASLRTITAYPRATQQNINYRLRKKFSSSNVIVLQMFEYFCHVTFRRNSVYRLILRKVCAINK